MKNNILKKINSKKSVFILAVTMSIVFMATMNFAMWLDSKELGGYVWMNEDGSYPTNGWMFIDDNNDGVGSYYCFNKEGVLLVDTITEDYRVVNELGQLIDNASGQPVYIFVDNELAEGEGQINYVLPKEFLKKDNSFDGHAVLKKIDLPANFFNPNAVAETTTEAPKSQILIGENVVLRKENEYYDPNISRRVENHIISGNSYTKKTSGTIFTKTKWSGVTALKGDGAYFIAKNEKNNFNRVKGKIATHYFTYSDRTTTCAFSIWDVDNEELLYSTSSFNYNNGVSFDVIFYKTLVNNLRFELSVSGEYTSRIAYIKDLVFGFDKQAYKEELEELEEESIIEAMYMEGANISTVSEIVEYETNEEGEKVEKGNEDYAGPAFDKDFHATRSDIVAPDGSIVKSLIPAKEG